MEFNFRSFSIKIYIRISRSLGDRASFCKLSCGMMASFFLFAMNDEMMRWNDGYKSSRDNLDITKIHWFTPYCALSLKLKKLANKRDAPLFNGEMGNGKTFYCHSAMNQTFTSPIESITESTSKQRLQQQQHQQQLKFPRENYCSEFVMSSLTQTSNWWFKFLFSNFFPM